MRVTTPLILIVDDQDTNRRVYTRLAAKVDGALVESLAHPEEALLWLESHNPDLIITDFRMPGLDGAEFTRRVRSMPSGTDLPIIVVTVFQDRNFRLSALEAGATDFLLSPVDHVEFCTRVRNLLALRRQQQQLRQHACVLERELAESESSRERLLRDSREALAQVIDTVPAFISAADPEGRCVFANAQLARALNAAPAELVGRNMAELLGPAGRRGRKADRLVLERGIAIPAYEEERQDSRGQRQVMLTAKAPLRDATGSIVSVLSSSLDITARKLAEEQLREMESRQSFLLQLGDELRPLNNVADIQATACRLLGQHLRVAQVGLGNIDPQQAKVAVDIEWNDGRLPSVAGAWRAEAFGAAVEGGTIRDTTVAVSDLAGDQGPDPVEVTVFADTLTRSYLNVPRIKDGRPVAMLFIRDPEPHAWSPAEIDLVVETCERLWAAVERAWSDAALRESQQKLAMALHAAHMGTFDWDATGDRFALTTQSADLFGLAFGSFPSTSDDVFAVVHPNDVAQHRSVILGVSRAGGDYHSEYRIIRPRDGRVVWIEERGSAAVEPATGRVRVKGVHWDVSERKVAEERQTLLAREVDHRAKNALAIVQTALRLVPKDNAETFARAVEGRVMALARALTLLSNESWQRADLHTLIQGELGPFLGVGSGKREEKTGPWVELHGPLVDLPPRMAQPLAMAVHELATNAAKHGSLSVPKGRVTISWRNESEGPTEVLFLRWVEEGGPPLLQPPDKRGFGTRVLNGTLGNQLGGRVSLAWETSGLVCEAKIPLGSFLR